MFASKYQLCRRSVITQHMETTDCFLILNRIITKILNLKDWNLKDWNLKDWIWKIERLKFERLKFERLKFELSWVVIHGYVWGTFQFMSESCLYQTNNCFKYEHYYCERSFEWQESSCYEHTSVEKAFTNVLCDWRWVYGCNIWSWRNNFPEGRQFCENCQTMHQGKHYSEESKIQHHQRKSFLNFSLSCLPVLLHKFDCTRE